jgi:hypothetical protein
LREWGGFEICNLKFLDQLRVISNRSGAQEESAFLPGSAVRGLGTDGRRSPNGLSCGHVLTGLDASFDSPDNGYGISGRSFTHLTIGLGIQAADTRPEQSKLQKIKSLISNAV